MNWVKGLLAVCCGALLAAQDVATIARFVDPDGKPIADGEVVFATTPVGVADVFAPAHVVRGTTDAAGRCRVLLRSGASHSAWAIGPAGEGGRWRTRVVEGVVAGDAVTLTAAERSASRPLAMADLTPFGAGPFRLELRCDAQHGPVWSLDVASGQPFALPELPAGLRIGRLFASDGRVVVGTVRCLETRAAFAAPRRETVEVVDENGKPVAGARVGMLASSYVGHDPVLGGVRKIDCLVEGPPTDGEGRSTWTVADAPNVFVAWTADRFCRVGRAAVQRIVDGELRVDDEGRPKPGEIVRLVLREGPVLRGTLRRGEQVLEAHGVLATTTVLCEHVKNGSRAATWFEVSQRVRTDAQGAFTIAGVPRPIGALQLALEPFDDVPTLLRPLADVPAAPVTIDLAAWPELTWQWKSDAAVPAAVRVLLWPVVVEDRTAPPLVLVGDRAGRVRARIEPGAWFLVATDGDGIAAVVEDVAAGASRTVELRASPLARMTGRAVRADGSPAAGLVFQCSGWSANNEPEREPPAARLLRRYQDVINRGLVARALTDADGRFDVRFLAVPAREPTGLLGAAEVQYRAATDVVITIPD